MIHQLDGFTRDLDGRSGVVLLFVDFDYSVGPIWKLLQGNFPKLPRLRIGTFYD